MSLHSNPFVPGKSAMARPPLSPTTFAAPPQQQARFHPHPSSAAVPVGGDGNGDGVGVADYDAPPPVEGSTTWTSSSGEFGVFSEGDDVDGREGLIDEYNRIAKKYGIRAIVSGDFSSQEVTSPESKRSRRKVSSESEPTMERRHHKPLAQRRSVSDMAHQLVHPGRKSDLKDTNLSDLVRLCGKSLFYLPTEYAPGPLLLPTCLRATAQYLVQKADTRGIFRVSGSAKVVDALYDYYYTSIDGKDIHETTSCPTLPSHIKFNVYDVASVFKRLLAGLPGGILGSLPVLDALVAVHSQLDCGPELSRTRETMLRARLIALIISSVSSQYQRELICAVFGLLSLVGRTAETTPREDDVGHPLPTGDLMGYNALGIVFGPLLVGDLLDSYSMKLADPAAGLVLFPVTPSKSKKSKHIHRPHKRDKPKTNFQDSQTSLTIDKLHEVNSITEMVIINWRDVVRHMRSLDVLKTKRQAENRGLAKRERALRTSASESFMATRARAWSGGCPSTGEAGRSVSHTPATTVLRARSISAASAGPSSEQKQPRRRTTSTASSQKKTCPLSPTVEEGALPGPALTEQAQGNDVPLTPSRPSVRDDTGGHEDSPANSPIPALSDEQHCREACRKAAEARKSKTPRHSRFHRRHHDRPHHKLFSRSESSNKKQKDTESPVIHEPAQVDEGQIGVLSQDEKLAETKKHGGHEHLPLALSLLGKWKHSHLHGTEPTAAQQASVHFDTQAGVVAEDETETAVDDGTPQEAQEPDGVSVRSKSSKKSKDKKESPKGKGKGKEAADTDAPPPGTPEVEETREPSPVAETRTLPPGTSEVETQEASPAAESRTYPPGTSEVETQEASPAAETRTYPPGTSEIETQEPNPADEEDLQSQRSVESPPKSSREKGRFRGAAARIFARKNTSDSFASSSTAAGVGPSPGLPARKRRLYNKFSEGKSQPNEVDDLENFSNIRCPLAAEASGTTPDGVVLLVALPDDAVSLEVDRHSTPPRAETGGVQVVTTVLEDPSHDSAAHLETTSTEKSQSDIRSSGSSPSSNAEEDRPAGTKKEVAQSIKSQPVRASTPQGELKATTSEINLRMIPLRRKAKGILTKLPRGFLHQFDHGQSEPQALVVTDFDTSHQSQEAISPPIHETNQSTQQEDTGLDEQKPESPPPRRLPTHRVYHPHKPHDGQPEKSKDKEKSQKRRFLAHRIYTSSSKVPEYEPSLAVEETQTPPTPQEQETPVAEPLQPTRPSESPSIAEPSSIKAAPEVDSDTIENVNDITTSLQRQMSTGSNSLLHAQVRSLARQLEARTEETAQLRRRLEAREILDVGSLSEQLRRARSDAASWRRRAEAAERRVAILERVISRIRALRDTGKGGAKGKSIAAGTASVGTAVRAGAGVCACPCPRPDDGAFDGARSTGHDVGSWEIESLSRDQCDLRGQEVDAETAEYLEKSAQLWDAVQELLEVQDALDREEL